MSIEVLGHRLIELDKDVAELRASHRADFVELRGEQKAQETRIRALEITTARILGWAAGGAFIGGAVWTALAKLVPLLGN